MLLIRCPWCGEREETEFVNRGEAHIVRPPDPAGLSENEWGDHLFFRKNTRGWQSERWSHDFGCRRWFNMARNSATGEILATYKPGEPAPGLPPGPGAGAPAKEGAAPEADRGGTGGGDGEAPPPGKGAGKPPAKRAKAAEAEAEAGK